MILAEQEQINMEAYEECFEYEEQHVEKIVPLAPAPVPAPLFAFRQHKRRLREFESPEAQQGEKKHCRRSFPLPNFNTENVVVFDIIAYQTNLKELSTLGGDDLLTFLEQELEQLHAWLGDQEMSTLFDKIFPHDIDEMKLGGVMITYQERTQALRWAIVEMAPGTAVVEEKRDALLEMVNRSTITLEWMRRARLSFIKVLQTRHDRYSSDQNTLPLVIREADTSALNGFQKAVRITLASFARHGLRHTGVQIYKPVRDETTSKFMFYFARANTIQSQLYSMLGSSESCANWLLLTDTPVFITRLAAWLVDYSGDDFPVYAPSWQHVAFTDGVYDLKECLFYHPEDVPAGLYVYKFFDREAPEIALQERLHASPFFQHGIDPREPVEEGEEMPKHVYPGDWASYAEELVVRRVIEYQWPSQLPSENKKGHVWHADVLYRMFYAMIGRLMFQHDNWQKFLVIIGKAGTGKTLICDIIKKFFNTGEVAVFTSQMQTQFGLSILTEYTRLWMISEMSEGLQLDPCDWRLLVDRSELPIRVKYAEPRILQNHPNGMGVGNSFTGWENTGDSIHRRLHLLYFDRKVEQVDTELEKQADHEVAEFMIVCAHAYRSLEKLIKDEVPGKNLEPVEHYIFKENLKTLQKGQHPQLTAFMQSSWIHTHTPTCTDCPFPNKKCFVPLEAFERAFTDYSRKQTGVGPKMDRSTLQQVVASMGYAVETRRSARWPPAAVLSSAHRRHFTTVKMHTPIIFHNITFTKAYYTEIQLRDHKVSADVETEAPAPEEPEEEEPEERKIDFQPARKVDLLPAYLLQERPLIVPGRDAFDARAEDLTTTIEEPPFPRLRGWTVNGFQELHDGMITEDGNTLPRVAILKSLIMPLNDYLCWASYDWSTGRVTTPDPETEYRSGLVLLHTVCNELDY